MRTKFLEKVIGYIELLDYFSSVKINKLLGNEF